MKIIKTSALFVACLALLISGTTAPAFGEATKVRVSANAPIRDGDVAGAQSEAQEEALVKSVEKILAQIVPDRTYKALETLLDTRIIPQAERFISHYQIVNQDVSDLAYTVHLSVTVDTDLLRKNLGRIGVIKEPGSPALGAVFVTVDAPLGLDHVKTLGRLAQETVTTALEGDGLVLIPPPDDDRGFRVVRPPQAPEALVSEGLVALADLAVGVIFKKNGEAVVTGSTMILPMYVTIQAVDVKTGTIVDVALRDVEVSMGTRDGALLSKDLGQNIEEMAGRISANLTQRYLAGETERGSVSLVFENRHDAARVRRILNEIQFRLGETTSIVPEIFRQDLSRYVIWTSRSLEDVAAVLSRLRQERHLFDFQAGEDEIVIVMKNDVPATGVLEFGEEVTFYRRLPVPGIENPDDIRKIEFVHWQENENNSEAGSANIAPVGMSILGRIDPSRDKDFYRFELPEGAGEVSVAVEQTGPGEVRSRVRIFSAGKLLADQVSSSRGRNLYFTFPVPHDMKTFRLAIEDFLGRYSSMFPYVLKVGVSGDKTSDESS